MGVRDFIDITYAYAINSDQYRSEFRSGMNAYIYDIQIEVAEEEHPTFEGFQKQALDSDLLAEMDALMGA